MSFATFVKFEPNRSGVLAYATNEDEPVRDSLPFQKKALLGWSCRCSPTVVRLTTTGMLYLFKILCVRQYIDRE